MAEVYAALDVQLERRVALKVLAPELAADAPPATAALVARSTDPKTPLGMASPMSGCRTCGAAPRARSRSLIPERFVPTISLATDGVSRCCTGSASTTSC